MRWIYFIICSICYAFVQGATDRPNILWLVSEDNGPFLGCYGDENADTPHLDALAARGLRFDAAFATSPVCAPARFALATGVYPNSAGTENMRSRFSIPNEVRFLSSYLRQAGYYCTNNAKEDYNTVKPKGAWDESSRQASWRNRGAGQPFFHVQNFHETHESSLHKGSTPKVQDPAKMRLPAYHPDVPEVRSDWAVYYECISAMDASVGKVLQQLEADGLRDSTIVFYFSDHGGALGRGKRFLYESGLRVPLIVYLPEPYAHLGGKPAGSTIDRLVTFADLPPTVLSLAGVTIPEQMQGHPFLPEGAAPPAEYAFATRGRMDERIDGGRTVRDNRYRYIRNWLPFRSHAQHLQFLWRAPNVRAWEAAALSGDLPLEQMAFFNPQKPGEELYDCINDPDNVRNLAQLEEYAPVLERMRSVLDDWILSVRDINLLPEAELAARTAASESTAYALARSDAYDIESVLNAANLSSRATLEDLPTVLHGVFHAEAGVRYWTACTLTRLKTDSLEALAALNQLLQDASPSVRLQAAEAVYRLGEMDNAEKVLLTALESESLMNRVHALNIISSVEGAELEPFAAVLDVILQGPEERAYDRRLALSLRPRVPQPAP
jgi:arylsulfatase A-like enzyme